MVEREIGQAPQDVRQAILEEVEAFRETFLRISREIHANPELAYAEFKAVELLTGLLEKEKFVVERGYVSLPTAFRATRGEGLPSVAFLAEYDALAGIGHACGHNLMGTASVGAGVVLANVLERLGHSKAGYVCVLGTPAEEGGGGKIPMVERGAFNGIDAALIFHPNNKTLVRRGSLTAQNVKIEFFGRSSHAAAAPDEGINALDGVLQTFSGLNAMRQHLRSDARVHGIISSGGQAPNVVPDYASAEFIVRAGDMPYTAEVLARFRRCAEAASIATGARLVFTVDPHPYDCMVANDVLADIYARNLVELGVTVEEPLGNERMGSTDMGNVSQVVPSLHPYLQIIDAPLTIHTIEFREAAVSPRGEEGMFNALKALALTGADLLLAPTNLAMTKEAFLAQQAAGLVRGPVLL